MSKFFKALEQAERDRARSEEAARQKPRGPEAPEPMGLPMSAIGSERPVSERSATYPPGQSAPAPPEAAVDLNVTRAVQMPGPPADGIDRRLVSLLAPATFEAEQYRALRHLVEQQKRDAGRSLVAVSSPAVGDGKTTTAINLAGALAQAANVRVLLVDADLRRPTLAADIGLARPESEALLGLVDLITNPRLVLEDLVQRRADFNLAILPAGEAPEGSYELLQSPRFAELLADVRREYDYVVLDTPPLVAVPDCRIIEKRVDGLLIVVRAHWTPRKLVEEALNLVDPAKMLGLVFNDDDRPLAGYYRGYSYRSRVGNSHASNGHSPSRWNRILRGAPGKDGPR